MRTTYSPDRVIVRIMPTNPRKPTTQGYEAWECLTEGMTFAQYVAAVARRAAGKIAARDHLDWDRAHGWVRFADETPEAASEIKTPAPKVAEFNPDVAPVMESAPEATDLAAAVDARLAAEQEKPLTKAERKALRKQQAQAA
jgi:hypothetical protein